MGSKDREVQKKDGDKMNMPTCLDCKWCRPPKVVDYLMTCVHSCRGEGGFQYANINPGGCHYFSAKEESVTEQFDFETWWKNQISIHADGPTSHLCALRGLYEKMKEWGFSDIWFDWKEGEICIELNVRSMRFHFGDILNYPRALRDCFKWMYENRVNKKVCSDCGKELGSEMFSDELEMSERIKTGGNSYSDRWRTKSDKLFCPECHYKKHPKMKCDKDGPCASLKRAWGEYGTNPALAGMAIKYCPFCGEKRNP